MECEICGKTCPTTVDRYCPPTARALARVLVSCYPSAGEPGRWIVLELWPCGCWQIRTRGESTAPLAVGKMVDRTLAVDIHAEMLVESAQRMVGDLR